MLALIYCDELEQNELTKAVNRLKALEISTVVLADKKGFQEAAIRCDMIVVIGDASKVERVIRGWGWAKKPIYSASTLQIVEDRKDLLSWTEINAPQQVRSFMEIIMNMYQIHLDKNADYSPANITGPGMIGIATRMWDKIVRIMNLTGFNITAEHKGFTHRKDAVNEPYMDAFLDVSVYGVIAQIFEEGKWGK